MRRLVLFPLFFLAAGLPAAEPVTVAHYADVAVRIDRQTTARVESLNESVLAAELSARVLAFEVRPGEAVAAGQRLVRLDPASYQLRLDSARARLDVARAGLDMATIRAERARRLAPERFLSEDDLLEAETRLRQARAELAMAEAGLAEAELMIARTEVAAPFAGVVSRRMIGAGALAAPGTPLLELIALDRIEVVASVAPDLVAGLELAEAIVFDDGTERRAVRVARVFPLIERGSRNRQLRFEFVDEPAVPGSDGRILWTDPRPALPADLILQRNGRMGVLAAVDGRAKFIELAGADAGRPFRADLPADTRLIIDGRRRLQPGAEIRIID